MTIIDLGNNLVKLTAPNGVRNIRTGHIYSEAVCNKNQIRHYEAVEE